MPWPYQTIPDNSGARPADPDASYGWFKRGFYEEGFDREGPEKRFSFGYAGDGFGPMSGQETGIGVFRDARAGAQITACEQINDAAHFFD